MDYIDPKDVISPQRAISDVRVLVDEGEDAYALAVLKWEGEDRLGVRWNGGPDNPIGNPQSRGIPTWFLLPEAIADMVMANLGGELDYTTGITRVRIRPLPMRIRKGRAQERRDDLWILADAGDGAMEVNNLATNHRILLERAHVKRLLADTIRDTPKGPKHGLLELNVQIVFENGEARMEIGQMLQDRVSTFAAELLRRGYRGQHDRVRALIDEARVDLMSPDSTLGPWEMECLDYAAAAVDANFLRLALASIDKAFIVNGLSAEEYEHGFHYNKRHGGGAPAPRVQ